MPCRLRSGVWGSRNARSVELSPSEFFQLVGEKAYRQKVGSGGQIRMCNLRGKAHTTKGSSNCLEPFLLR